MYEWRPTLDPTDRVRGAMAGEPGTRWNYDDDGDGRVDEEILNGRDDDGDGLVDEDFDLPSQQLLTAEYTDDQPEAVLYSSSGEQHVPLGLSVHQEAFAWTQADAEDIAGLRFVITNTGDRMLTDLRLGLYVDLDSREAASRGGHLDDRVMRLPYELLVPEGVANARAGGDNWKTCLTRLSGEAVVVADDNPDSGLPCGAVVPLTHTTDPLALLRNEALPGVREARSHARAPAKDTTFRTYVFAQDMPPGQGGPPRWTRAASRPSREAGRSFAKTECTTMPCWFRAVRSPISPRAQVSSSASRSSGRRFQTAFRERPRRPGCCHVEAATT